MKYLEEQITFIEKIKRLQELTKNYAGVQTLPFFDKKATTTVTFAYSTFSRSSIYSVFNIWYALNNYSDDYRCFVLGVGNDNGELLDNHNIHLSADVIRLTNILVLPFVTEDLTPHIKSIKAINPKIKIYYQIDFDFTAMDILKPNYQHFQKPEIQNQIFENIKQVDNVIFSSENLCSRMVEIYGAKLTGTGIGFIGNISFLNREQIDEITAVKIVPKPNEPIRVGVLVTKENTKDVKSHAMALKEIAKQFPTKIQFVTYGDETEGMRKALSGVKHEFTQQTGLESYYNELVSLNLSAIIIFTNDTDWNVNHYDVERVMELMAIGIPVIVNDIDPVNKLIVDETNGYVFKDKDHLKRILSVIAEVDFSETTDCQLIKIRDVAFGHVHDEFDISRDKCVKIIEQMF
jgi:glycosyltransferase involved in cell wall biosynthesis